jgi:hypothetical protein
MEKEIFELKVPRNSEETPEAMAGVFASLSNYTSSLWERLFGERKCVVFEVGLFKQRIHFYAVIEKEFSPYFTSQLAAQYPKVSFVKQKSDYLQTWDFEKAAYGQLKFNNSYWFPLRTYRDFKDIDPLSSLLGTLSKAGPHDKAIFQLVVAPVGAEYQRGARKIIEKGIPQPEGEGRKAHPQAHLIKDKIAQKGLHTGLRLAGVSVNQQASKSFLSHLAGSFGSFTLGEGNSLQLHQRKIFKQRLLQAIKNRQFKTTPRYQYLNIDELATIFHLPNEKLSKIRNISWGGRIIGEPPEDLPVADELTGQEKKKVNFFARTEFKNKTRTLGIKENDRRRHMYIIGKTGVGKSTNIANMVINDMRNNKGLAVLDPHGDLCDILLDYVPSYRLNDVCYLDPSDSENAFHLNPLQVKNKDHGELVASGIVSIFHKLYHYSWGPRMEYIFRNALMTLVNRPQSTLVDVLRILSDDQFRKRVVDQYCDQVLENFWYNEFNKMSERLRSQAVSPIQNKVGQFVNSPTIRNIIGHPHSTIDLREFMDEGKILIINLSQGQIGEDNAALLGAMLITKMQLAAMSRVNMPEQDRRDFYLFVDEFQNFATSSFVKILSEARKYRLNITVANQYMGQLSKDMQEAIFGNVGTLMSFLVGAQDARYLSREFGERYDEEDLVALDNFEVLLRLSIDRKTCKPFYAKTLPLPDCRNKNRDKVLRLSREQYTKPINKE